MGWSPGASQNLDRSPMASSRAVFPRKEAGGGGVLVLYGRWNHHNLIRRGSGPYGSI